MVDCQLAGHGVAAPQQGGEQQEQIGGSMHREIPAGVGRVIADLLWWFAQVNDVKRENCCA
jgi:hypothetical protein